MMMSLVETSETDHSTSMRQRLSRKKWCQFIMIISEDLLYEDRLKSGEVVLLQLLLQGTLPSPLG